MAPAKECSQFTTFNDRREQGRTHGLLKSYTESTIYPAHRASSAPSWAFSTGVHHQHDHAMGPSPSEDSSGKSLAHRYDKRDELGLCTPAGVQMCLPLLRVAGDPSNPSLSWINCPMDAPYLRQTARRCQLGGRLVGIVRIRTELAWVAVVDLLSCFH